MKIYLYENHLVCLIFEVFCVLRCSTRQPAVCWTSITARSPSTRRCVSSGRTPARVPEPPASGTARWRPSCPTWCTRTSPSPRCRWAPQSRRLCTDSVTHLLSPAVLRLSTRGRTSSSWRRISTSRALWTGWWCSPASTTTSCWFWKSRRSTRATSSSSPWCCSSARASRARTSPTGWSWTETAGDSPGRPRRAPSTTAWRRPSWTATAWCSTPPSHICSPTTVTWGLTWPSPCAEDQPADRKLMSWRRCNTKQLEFFQFHLRRGDVLRVMGFGVDTNTKGFRRHPERPLKLNQGLAGPVCWPLVPPWILWAC